MLPEIRLAVDGCEGRHGDELHSMPVLGARVLRVTDLEGNVTQIICAEYEEAAGTCRLKKSALSGGPLAQLLERTSENTLGSRGTLCALRQT